MTYRNETPLQEDFKEKSVAFGRSEVTPAMATRSAAVGVTVKCRPKPSKRFVCSTCAESVTTAKRDFRRKFHRSPPRVNSVLEFFELFFLLRQTSIEIDYTAMLEYMLGCEIEKE